MRVFVTNILNIILVCFPITLVAQDGINPEDFTDETIEKQASMVSEAIEQFLNICKDPTTQKLSLEREYILPDGTRLDCAQELDRIQVLREGLKSAILIRDALVNSSVMSIEEREALKSSIENSLSKVPLQCSEEEVFKQSLGSCLVNVESLKGSCVYSLAKGIVKDIYYTGTGLVDLAQMVGDAFQNNNKSMAEVPQTQNESEVSSAPSLEPSNAMIDFTKAIAGLLDQTIRNDFGCELRDQSGKCLEPMSNWKCASCRQRIASICGVGGYLTGEIGVSYLFGLGIIATGETLSPAAQYIRTKFKNSKHSQKCSNAIQGLFKSPRSLLAKIRNSPSHQMFTQALKNSKSHKLVKTAKAVLRVSAKTAQPLISYLKLMDKAFELGSRHAKVVSGEAKNLIIKLKKN